jgi:hypothetical protein
MAMQRAGALSGCEVRTLRNPSQAVSVRPLPSQRRMVMLRKRLFNASEVDENFCSAMVGKALALTELFLLVWGDEVGEVEKDDSSP